MQLNTTMQQGDKLGQCLIRKTWFVTWSLRLKQYMCPSAIALKCYYICWSWLCVCYIIHVHVLHKNWVDSDVVSKEGRSPPPWILHLPMIMWVDPYFYYKYCIQHRYFLEKQRQATIEMYLDKFHFIKY